MDSAFIDDVCSTLQTGLDIIRSASDASVPSPTRDRVAAVAEGVKSEAAKLGYMFSQNNLPDKVAGEALIAGLRDTATTLCMLFAAAASGGGPSLRKSLETISKAVIEPTIDLIKAVAAVEGAHAEGAGALPQFAGLVMERCDLAGKAPLDDRTAIGRALTSVARQINDAAKELSEELATDASEDGDAEEEEESEKKQKEVIRGAMNVIEAAGNVVRATMRELLTADASPEQAGELWESILFHGKQLAGAVDDLAIASYSSEEHEDVRGSAESVVTSCELIGEEVTGETVRQGVAAVEEAGEKLMGLL